jgi:hypothetical protein
VSECGSLLTNAVGRPIPGTLGLEVGSCSIETQIVHCWWVSFQNRRFSSRMDQMSELPLMLMSAVLAANLPTRTQHMNEKESPCAGAVV